MHRALQPWKWAGITTVSIRDHLGSGDKEARELEKGAWWSLTYASIRLGLHGSRSGVPLVPCRVEASESSSREGTWSAILLARC